ncbi:hypothetical protein P7K49_021227 [Saguinus oedipus]|uniref:Uncharacterized protein n=1 Tax=Saguinus oedipus TaxID=9490 RepID=A0ABQ9USU2_SAGOE|nr:hypothetical protein P7K49_021227 [Saguinus oedipus]
MRHFVEYHRLALATGCVCWALRVKVGGLGPHTAGAVMSSLCHVAQTEPTLYSEGPAFVQKTWSESLRSGWSLQQRRISRAVEQAAPWLILAGSGGIADVIAALVNQPHLLVPKMAEKQFKEKFPSEHFSWEDIVHWTKLPLLLQTYTEQRDPGWAQWAVGTQAAGWHSLTCGHCLCLHWCRPWPAPARLGLCSGTQLQNIASHPHLFTVYDFEQEGSEELDTVILKTLVKGEGGQGGLSGAIRRLHARSRLGFGSLANVYDAAYPPLPREGGA